MDRLNFLRDLIDRADHAYYNSGSPILEDAIYDSARAELKLLSPGDPCFSRVGAPVSADSALVKRRHSIPMGSQSKCMNLSEFEAWQRATSGAGTTIVHGSFKMDGASVSLEYINGVLFRAITRGEGEEGEDITANVAQFKGTPKTCMFAGKPFSGFVRAEAMLLVDDWKQADPEMEKNPRNCGNGIARRKDGSDAGLITVFAFRAHFASGEEIAGAEDEMSKAIESMGFTVAPWMVGTAGEVASFFERTLRERSDLPFWIDGIVAKVNDLRAQAALGSSAGCPKGQTAIKFPPMGARTVLRSITVTVGHTGAVVPTANFDPVQIAGTTVSRASLSNFDELAALDLAIGDEVLVTKQGDIIPKIVAVLNRPATRVVIGTPTHCPVCGTALVRKTNVDGEDGALLFCPNEDCESRVLGKLDRWFASLNILGAGDEVNVMLHDAMGVRDVADLYALDGREAELAAQAVGQGRFGEKRAAKLLAAISAKRLLTLDELLGSLGIDTLGKRRVELVRSKVPGEMDTLEAWMSGKLVTLAERAGVPNTAVRIVADLTAKRSLIERLLRNGVSVRHEAPAVALATNPAALSFCMTGKLSQPKSHFAALITAKGHVVRESVAKGLHYLVMADPDSTSAKAVAARKLGTKTIGEADLLSLLGGS